MDQSKISFDNIVKNLDSNSLDERLQALDSLYLFDTPEACEHFIRMLRDSSSEVQIKSAEALIKYKDRRSIPQLIETLNDKNKEVKKRVIYVLGELRDKTTVEPLLELLSDPRGEIRREVISALGKLGDERAVEPLINILSDDNKYVRLKAIEILGILGDERAIEPIIHKLEDASSDVKIEAVVALKKLGDTRSLDKILSLFSDPNPGVRKEALNTARVIGDDRTIESYLKMLGDDVVEVRMAAVQALSEINDQRSIEGLVKLLEDTNWKVRFEVVNALKKTGVYDVIEKISDNCIKDPNPEVRKAFLSFLILSSDEKYVEKAGFLVKDENKEVRQLVVDFFNAVGSEKVISYLVEFLRDSNPDVRVSAIRALGKISSEKSADSLLELINDEFESYIKKEVIEAIDGIGNVNYVEKLKKLLKDEDPTVRESVAKILRKNNLLNYEHFMEAARAYYKETKYREALECINKIEDIGSYDNELNRMKAYSLFMLGKLDDSYNAYKQVLNGNYSAEVLKEISELEEKRNNISSAVSMLEQYVNKNVNDFASILKLAKLYEKNHDAVKASWYYKKVEEKETDNIYAALFFFRENIDTKPEKAMSYFNIIWDKNYVDEKIYIKAAEYFEERNETHRLVDLCKKLEENNISSPLINYFNSIFYLSNNLTGEFEYYFSKIEIDKLVAVNPDYVLKLASAMLENSFFEKVTEICNHVAGIVEYQSYVNILEKLYKFIDFSEWLELYKKGREHYQNVDYWGEFILRTFLDRNDYTLFEKYFEEAIDKFGNNNALKSIKADSEFRKSNYLNASILYREIYSHLNISQLERFAVSLFKISNYDEAKKEYEILVEKTGKNEYEIRLADLYIETGDMEKATVIAEKLLSDAPDSYEPYVVLGKIYYYRKNISEALTAFKRSIDIEKKNPDALLGLASIYIDRKIFEEAYLLLNEVREEFPENRDYHRITVKYYEKQNKWNEALNAINNIIEIYPEDTYWMYRLARAYFKLSRKNEGMNILNNIDISILGKEEQFETAVILEENGEISKAEKLFLNILEKYGEKAEYLYRYCLLNSEYAISKLPGVLSVKKYPEYHEKLNFAYIKALINYERFDEAAIRLADLCEKYPDNAQFVFETAMLYFKKGDLNKSSSFFEKSIMLSDKSSQAYYYLAKIHEKNNEFEKALSCAVKSMKEKDFRPSKHFYNDIAAYYEKIGRYENSLEYVENALKIDSEDVEMKYFKANLFYKLGKYMECSQIMEYLTYQNKNSVEYFELAGNCEKEMENYNRAISFFRRCLELSEDTLYKKELAILLQKTGRVKEASALFEELKTNNDYTQDDEFLYHQALSEYLKSNFNESLQYLNKLISSGKRDFNVILLAARIYMKKELFDKAISYYEMIEEEISTDAELVLEYSLAYENVENIDKAIFVAEKGAVLDDDRIYLKLANLYFIREMYGEALENIKNVLKIIPDSKEALNLKGLIYEKKEMYENSIK
ncbi:MAG: HEAT repeat domain-containing protein, partial [Candidatus Muiribacteriota bacterium]